MATDSKGGESTGREMAPAGVSAAAEPASPSGSGHILGRFSQVHLLSAALVAAVAGIVAAYVGFAMLLKRGG